MCLGLKVWIYELKWEFKEAYSFILLDSFVLPSVYGTIESVTVILRLAAAMLVLSVIENNIYVNSLYRTF